MLLVMLSLTSFAQSSKKGADAPDKRLAGLDTTFARVLKEWNAAGFAVAVVEKNRVIWAKGYGYRDFEHKLPVTANTRFAIGSCTKAFTSTLIGLLNKEGKVDYDKPVSTYLPDVKFYNDELYSKVTLRDMMCHRTGLPRHDYSWYLFTTESRDSLISRIQYLEPSAGLREKWQYNNFMFLLQGAVVEKLTGKSWEENVKERLFTPLGMTNSDLSVKEMAENEDVSYGYEAYSEELVKKMDYYQIKAMGPAGSINSSVTDMSRWLMAWINNGNVNGKEVFPIGYRNEAISGQMIIGGGLPAAENPDIQFSNYGFGWMMCSYRGHYRVEHGGNIDGFSASTCFFPSDSIGIVVLSNQNGSQIPGIVRNYISDQLLNEKYTDWSSKSKKTVDASLKAIKEALKTASSNRKPNAPATHPVKDYEGIYANKGYGNFIIELKNDTLFARVQDKKFWLQHHHYDIFNGWLIQKPGKPDTVNQQPVLFQFNMDLSGDIQSTSIQLEPTIKPIGFDRSAKELAITQDDLTKYTGEYLLGGVVAKFYLKGTNVLYLLVPGQPEYEMVPVEKDRFGLKTIKGYYTKFTVTEEGEVTEVIFQQPNGNFKATKKK